MRLILVALLLISLPATAEVPSARPQIAIIIDDLGYQLDAGRRAIELPGPIAFAFLPGSPRAKTLAKHAHELGKEVMLHLPLQAKTDERVEEPLGMHLDMSRKEFTETFGRALDAVPHAVGINNHRGSLLTRHPGHMRWLMEEIGAREGLFFVDSFTTHQSIALRMADEAGIDARRRDIFLDPDRDPATVAREFDRMKRLALKRGSIVAIGHPYKATLELLERELPKLADDGFELVTISDLVRARRLEPIRHSAL